VTFGDARGVEIMTASQLEILEAINGASMASQPVLVELVPDGDGGLLMKVRTPVSFEVTVDE
jgi:hypothetical protein